MRKNFMNILLGLLFVSGIFFLVAPVSIFPSFYDVRYMGWAALGGVAIIFLVPKLFRVQATVPRASQKNHGADVLQYFLLWAILANAVGDLGLYELYRWGFEFDKLVHFLTPLLAVYLLSYAWQLRFSVSFVRARILALFLTLCCIVVWEVYEYLIDWFWFTHLYGVFGSDVVNDTRFDIIFGIFGSCGGAFLPAPHLTKESK